MIYFKYDIKSQIEADLFFAHQSEGYRYTILGDIFDLNRCGQVTRNF